MPIVIKPRKAFQAKKLREESPDLSSAEVARRVGVTAAFVRSKKSAEARK